jgi:hypothetical protein
MFFITGDEEYQHECLVLTFIWYLPAYSNEIQYSLHLFGNADSFYFEMAMLILVIQDSCTHMFDDILSKGSDTQIFRDYLVVHLTLELPIEI